MTVSENIRKLRYDVNQLLFVKI